MLWKNTNFFCGKYGAVVRTLCSAVGDLLHEHRCLFFIYKPNCLCDELLRIDLEHGKGVRFDAVQDSRNGAPGQLGTFRNLAHKVIFDAAAFGTIEGIGLTLFCNESST